MNSELTRQLFSQINKDGYKQDDLDKMTPEERRKVLMDRLHKRTGISQMQRGGKKSMMKMLDNTGQGNNSEISNLMNSAQLSRSQKKKLRQKMNSQQQQQQQQPPRTEVISHSSAQTTVQEKPEEPRVNIQNRINDILNGNEVDEDTEDSYHSDSDDC
jgi:hypothetical protein